MMLIQLLHSTALLVKVVFADCLVYFRQHKFHSVTLIKSISGIRGIIGGKPNQGLTPFDIIKFSAAFGEWIKRTTGNPKIVIGRDARISGEMVNGLVSNTLIALGIEVIDAGLSTTPTVEMAVVMEAAGGGIILTASHNPQEWNALKLLNQKGEFISAEAGQEILRLGDEADFTFASVDTLGNVQVKEGFMEKHIQAILQHQLVNKEIIKQRNFKIVVDGINSTGAVFVPYLLQQLGVKQYTIIHGEMHGKFEHNPEPLPENLQSISAKVKEEKADLGIVVDPDVDRLCFVNEDGSLFGEEYSLVSIADYMLSHHQGNTVSNLSSTRALKDITLKHGGTYYASAVGEVNVVKKMKEVQAVIGGEGNGGIIVPELHYGRDALIGIALFLTHLAKKGITMTALRHSYPNYFMSKNKISLSEGFPIQKIFDALKEKYKQFPQHTEDGLKIEFEQEWVHLRTSNTEPIIRIYTESTSEEKAQKLAQTWMSDIQAIL
jgi:phosphomannomutase